MGILEVLNGKLLYTLVSAGILCVFCMCIFFYVRARRRAFELGISKSEFSSAMRGAAVFSVVPSVAVIIGLFSLAPVLGVPWPWFRLSVVGSLSYELMAADMAAAGAGYESLTAFGSSGDVNTLGTIMFVMSISIMAGMVCNIFFTKKIQMQTASYSNKNGAWGALSISCFTIAMMSTFLPLQMTAGIIPFLTALVSGGLTILLTWAALKYKIRWLADFIMSFALIAGMVAAVCFTNMGI